MFGIGTSELMIILAVGLIVIGPQKLPDLAKAIGRAVGEFRKATSEIKETLEGDENLASVKKTFEDAMHEGMNPTLVQETPEEAAQSTVLDNMPSPPPEYGLDESSQEEPDGAGAGEAGGFADQASESGDPEEDPSSAAESGLEQAAIAGRDETGAGDDGLDTPAQTDPESEDHTRRAETDEPERKSEV